MTMLRSITDTKLKADSMIGSSLENCYTFRTRMSVKQNNIAPLISENVWWFTCGPSAFTQISIGLPHSPICFAVLRVYCYGSLTVLYCFTVFIEFTLSSSPRRKRGGEKREFSQKTVKARTKKLRYLHVSYWL